MFKELVAFQMLIVLEIERFGCYKARIEESKKAGSHWGSNLGHKRILEVVRAGGCLVVIAQW